MFKIKYDATFCVNVHREAGGSASYARGNFEDALSFANGVMESWDPADRVYIVPDTEDESAILLVANYIDHK